MDKKEWYSDLKEIEERIRKDTEQLVAENKALKAENERLKNLVYMYNGGEDDGYGGKTDPITYKEAYEDDAEYDHWARREMKKACEKIKAHPKWNYGENAYPSPYERAIVAGCGQAVEELKAENERLKRELDVSVKYGVDFKQAWDECREKLKNSPNPVSVEDLENIKRMCDIILNNNLGDKELDSLALWIAHHSVILNSDRIYKDKPKEYCSCEGGILKPVLALKENGTLKCLACLKPIKTEKIEDIHLPFTRDEYKQLSGIVITKEFIQGVIDHINKKGV
jgi:hypothetical protein